MTDDPSRQTTPRLLSLTAHELRSPLSVVSGYLHMLLGPRGQTLPPDQRRLIELANASCARALALTHELSELARLTAGTAVLNPGTTDVARLLSEAVDEARREVPDVNISLAHAPNPTPVVADAERLRGALVALLIALAREVSPPRGLAVTLSADADAVTVEAVPDGQLDADDIRAGMLADSGTTDFDQYRGGLGLRLPVAVLVLEKLGGTIAAVPDTIPPGVRVTLPPTTP